MDGFDDHPDRMYHVVKDGGSLGTTEQGELQFCNAFSQAISHFDFCDGTDRCGERREREDPSRRDLTISRLSRRAASCLAWLLGRRGSSSLNCIL